MAQQDDGLLREVEEELRRERLEKIWKQYGTYFIAAAGRDRSGVLGFKYWENHKDYHRAGSGARYEEAMLLVNEKKFGQRAKRNSRRLPSTGQAVTALWRSCNSRSSQ